MYIVLEHQELRILIEELLHMHDPDHPGTLKWQQFSTKVYKALSDVLTAAITELNLSPETMTPLTEVFDHPDIDAVLYSMINHLSDMFGIENIRTICVLDGMGALAVNIGVIGHDANHRNAR
jgi:hypothetical protein